MQSLTPRRIIVIGGGGAGLAAAWRIQKSSQAAGQSVNLLLLEASSHVGGLIKSVSREGFLLETGADCFITEKPRAIGLCKELGLDGDLIGTRPDKRRSFILRKNEFYPVPEGFYLMGPTRARPFLQSRLLSWPGKFRAICEPLMFSRQPKDESLGSFVRRRFGKELLDWMAQPLIAGIYGANPEHLSLRATFPKFLDMERTYGSVVFGLKKSRSLRAQDSASGARYSLFATLRRGMQGLTDALVTKLGTAVIRTQARVKALRPESGAWVVTKANGEVLNADAVCVALPSYAAADLVSSFDPDLSQDLASIFYAPAATVNFAFRELDVKRPLDGVGFVVPQKENRLIMGCTFVQNKFEGRVPKGFMLLRAFLGGEDSARWMSKKDDALTNQVLGELKEWLNITGTPMFVHLERYERALPQYTVGHLERVVRIEERLFRYKGLALAGNWQYGVGIPDCIESGERAADTLLKQHTLP